MGMGYGSVSYGDVNDDGYDVDDSNEMHQRGSYVWE